MTACLMCQNAPGSSEIRRQYASEFRPGKEIDVQLGAMDLVARDAAQNRDEVAVAIATAQTARGAVRIVPEVQARATRVQVLGGRRATQFELPAVFQCGAAGCAMGGTYVPFSAVVRAFESPDKRHWALVSASLAPAGWRRPQVSVTVIRSPQPYKKIGQLTKIVPRTKGLL